MGKGMSLLCDMLSRFLMTFFSKEQASFNFIAAVTICSDLGAPKIKSDTVSTVSLSISLFPMNDGTRCHDLCFLNIEL